jgi:hypothetical protein
MARTYLPSEVSNIVALWRDDLKKVIYLTLSPLQHLENRGDEFFNECVVLFADQSNSRRVLGRSTGVPELVPRLAISIGNRS